VQLADFNAITSVGALLFGLSKVYFLFFVVISNLRSGEMAAAHALEGADGRNGPCPVRHPFTPSTARRWSN